jgi:ribosomal protein S4E
MANNSSKMSKNYLYILYIIVLSLITTCTRKYDCNEKEMPNQQIKYLTIGTKYLAPGDKISLNIDDGRFIYSNKPRKEHYINEDSYEVIIKDYCSINDSIKIKFVLNDIKDSIFYVNLNDYFMCYIGSSIDHEMLINLIYRDSTKNIGSD